MSPSGGVDDDGAEARDEVTHQGGALLFLEEAEVAAGMAGSVEHCHAHRRISREHDPLAVEAERERMAPESAIADSAFGVDLYMPVDVYQQTERSVKYGMLFLVLTFLAFFLFEVFSPVSLHPMHYLLVGSALCLFYVLLLSISEHIPFGIAYAIASAGIIVLISGYSLAILRGRRRALAMSGMLVILYSYLYVLLQAEDYALLLGSLGLFVILALVMYLTRKVDWYGPRMGKATAP